MTATEHASRTVASRPAGSRSARRSRPRRWKIALIVAAVLALAFGSAWALFGSSLLAVRSVRLSGSGPIPRGELLAAASIAIGTPLIRVDTNAVARRIERLTLVQSAEVRRSWPDAIVITTVLRTPVFALRAGGHSYDVMDSYGVILGHERRPPLGLVLLNARGMSAAAMRGNAGILAAGHVVRQLPAWLRHRVTSVLIGAVVTLVLRPGITVVWGSAASEAEKAETLAILLRTRATYYDVADPQSAVTGLPAGG